MNNELLISYLTALGIGLLIGTERERRKGDGPIRAPAGLRTFTIAALLGAVSWQLGAAPLLMLTLFGMALLAGAAYYRAAASDPGLTTEITLLLTTLLGAQAMTTPPLAAALGVVVTILLVARTPLHTFVRHTMTEQEIQDLILLAAAALVILPLAPNHTIDPLQAINPHMIWLIVVLMLCINAIGHIAGRALGPKQGLPLAGFVAGFISSAATISALGSRAKAEPQLEAPAVAGAVLSTVATIIQLALIIGVIDPLLLIALVPVIAASGTTALLYGLYFTLRTKHSNASSMEARDRPLHPGAALLFAGIVTVISVVVAGLNHYFGQAGATLGAAIAGLADTHAASATIANLGVQGNMDLPSTVLGVLTALTTNTFTKIMMARAMGSPAYARKVIPGLLLVIIAAWAGALPILR